MGLPRERRLRRRADFSWVVADGKGRSNTLVTLRYSPNGLTLTRAGFSVSKRLGHAVQRNRVKRLLREAVRHLDPKPGYDLILIARPEAAGARYEAVEVAGADVLRRAGLLREQQTAREATEPVALGERA